MSAFFREVLWQRLKRNRMAMAGALIVLTMFCSAVLAPVAGRDPGAIDIALRLQSPSFDYPLGTDDLGRDVLARILYGARISLLVGFVAVGIATFIGILLGAMAGFYGRWVDSLIMRFVDIMLCFPSFFLILAVIAFLEQLRSEYKKELSDLIKSNKTDPKINELVAKNFRIKMAINTIKNAKEVKDAA